MKRAICFVILFMVLRMDAFELAITKSNVDFTTVGDSYFYDPSATTPNVGGGWNDLTANMLMTRYVTNYWRYYNASRSGGTDIDVQTNRLYPSVFPFNGYRTNNDQRIIVIKATQNGYVSSNATYLSFSNFSLAPATMFLGDGSAVSPAGIAQTMTYQFWFMSDMPSEANDGNILTRGALSEAATNAGIRLATGELDIYYHVYSSWTNDYQQNGGTNVMWALLNTGKIDHPGKGGHLNAALATYKQWHSDTVISDETIDYSTGLSVSTNHCTVSGIMVSGNNISWTRHDDYIRFAWDVPNTTTGITNDCRNAFNLNPSDGTNFIFNFAVTNLPANHTYNVLVGGINIGTKTSAQLAQGVNMFTNYLHPEWLQAVEVLGLERDMSYVDRITLIQGSAGDGKGFVSYGSFAATKWQAGDRGDTLIANMTASGDQLKTYTDAIHIQVQPTNLVYSLEDTSSFMPAPFRP